MPEAEAPATPSSDVEDVASDVAETTDDLVVETAEVPDVEPVVAPLVIDRSSSNSVVVARLESRLRAAEDALERSTNRILEIERRQTSEMELVRARVDETMKVMSDTLQRQRTVQAETQERVAHQVATSERTTRSHVDDLRGELTPRVMRVAQQFESFQARLAGEMDSLNEEALARIGHVEEGLRTVQASEDRNRITIEDSVEDLRNFAIRRLMETSQSLQEYREEGLAKQAELSSHIVGLQSGQRESSEVTAARLDSYQDRLEEVDTELRGKVLGQITESSRRTDELVRDVTSRIDGIDDDVTNRLGGFQTALDAQLDRFADQLEIRLDKIEQDQQAARAALDNAVETRMSTTEGRVHNLQAEMLGRVDGLETAVTAAIDAERISRVESEQRLDRRAEELVAAAHEARQLSGTADVRHRAEVEGLAQRIDDVTRNVQSLQDQVAEAVTTIASRLSNEVATVGGDVMAVQEVVRDLEGRSAMVDQHRRRLDLLDEQLAETARVVRQVNQAVVGAVQRARRGDATAPAADAD